MWGISVAVLGLGHPWWGEDRQNEREGQEMYRANHGNTLWFLFQYRQTEGVVVQDKGVENPDHYDWDGFPLEDVFLLTYPVEKLEKDFGKKGFLGVKNGRKMIKSNHIKFKRN